MHFLLPFAEHDEKSALQWLQWVIELGGCRGHDITLMPAKKIEKIDTLRELAGTAFRSISVLPDAEGIEGHPQGPNSMMRQAIWHFQVAEIGPWTFMEPDCIPLYPGWADDWEREYRAFAKPFMGEFRPAHDVTPDYLSGNMVIPKGGLLMAPLLARRGLSIDGIELAFDIVAAKETLPQAHLTKLLQQVPKNEDGTSHSFPDAKSLDILRPGAVLFHPCKDGSLIDRLRERRAGTTNFNGSGELDSTGSHKPGSAGSIPAPATTSPIPSLREAELYRQVIELQAELQKLRGMMKTAVIRKKIGKRIKKARKPMSPEQKEAARARLAKAREVKKAKALA